MQTRCLDYASNPTGIYSYLLYKQKDNRKNINFGDSTDKWNFQREEDKLCIPMYSNTYVSHNLSWQI